MRLPIFWEIRDLATTFIPLACWRSTLYGKLKWYFQFTPHDVYDYDATQTPILVDVEEKGVARALVGSSEPQRLSLRSRPDQRQIS